MHRCRIHGEIELRSGLDVEAEVDRSPTIATSGSAQRANMTATAPRRSSTNGRRRQRAVIDRIN
jgi:hypothetical protein